MTGGRLLPRYGGRSAVIASALLLRWSTAHPQSALVPERRGLRPALRATLKWEPVVVEVLSRITAERQVGWPSGHSLAPALLLVQDRGRVGLSTRIGKLGA
jgi:hypothetical protein